jgi:AIPR protein
MASTSRPAVREYRIPVAQKLIKSFDDPHNEELRIHHAYVKVRDFPHGKFPDDVNPRSHEDIPSRIPEAIQHSLNVSPKWFHILNRGLLVLAQKAWYDNRSKNLHVLIDSDQEGGLADGATTDRVIRDVKTSVSLADFEKLKESEIPSSLRDAYVHVEIISGGIGDMLVPLTGARNTSNQVKEFALKNLGGHFDWLKDVIEDSQFRGRIRYRENDPQPVDVRTVLGLLTLFHPKWNELNKEPVIAYTSKGAILGYYEDEKWRPGYELLRPVVVEILDLYEYIHLKFNSQYKVSQGKGSKLGARKEVRYNENTPFKLPLTAGQTNYLIPDGWLYPLLAAFRMLLMHPRNGRGEVKWLTLPKPFYDKHGAEFVGDVCEQSENLGRNPNATGKSRPLWNNLRTKMELHRMKLLAAQE